MVFWTASFCQGPARLGLEARPSTSLTLCVAFHSAVVGFKNKISKKNPSRRQTKWPTNDAWMLARQIGTKTHENENFFKTVTAEWNAPCHIPPQCGTCRKIHLEASQPPINKHYSHIFKKLQQSTDFTAINPYCHRMWLDLGTIGTKLARHTLTISWKTQQQF